MSDLAIKKLLIAQQALAEVVALGILPKYEYFQVKDVMRIIPNLINLLEDNRKKVLDNRKST